MQLGVVVGSIWSSATHPAYEGRKQMLVQRVDLDRTPLGHPTVAIDYVSAGVGDTVLLGAAPGLDFGTFSGCQERHSCTGFRQRRRRWR